MSLGLLGAYNSSSSSSEGEEDAQPPTQPLPKLANPFLASARDALRPSYMVATEDVPKAKTTAPSSVFSNPFKAKEDHKKAILERHVEMTTKQEDQRTISGKKVCWNFRKGRCRFGSKCTFAHDNDVSSAKPSKDESSETSSQHQQPTPSTATTKEPDSSAVISNNKRKRPGLGDSLTPGKKAMKFYNKVYK